MAETNMMVNITNIIQLTQCIQKLNVYYCI